MKIYKKNKPFHRYGSKNCKFIFLGFVLVLGSSIPSFSMDVIDGGMSSSSSVAGRFIVEQPSKQQYNFPEILHLVENGEINISNIEGKNVVLVFGDTGSGKSTTINSLLGARMEEREDGSIDVEDGSRAEFAQIGHSKEACTALPAAWSRPDVSPYVYIDTRGFLGEEEHPEEDIAASILMEMAVKKANSIRIMVIADYNDLGKRARSFMKLGRRLSKIVVGQKIPMLFLFNRYQPLSRTLARQFDEKSFLGKEEEVIASVNHQINDIVKKEENTLNKVIGNIGKRLGRMLKKDDPEIEMNADFQASAAEKLYTVFLKYNSDLGNIGYIDPLSPEARNSILDRLSRMDSINPESLIFTGYNTDRVAFDSAFAHTIKHLLLLTKAKIRVSKFGLKLLEEMTKEAEACFNYHQQQVQTGDSRLVHISQDDLREVESAYLENIIDIQGRRIRLQQQRMSFLENRAGLERNITTLLSGSPKLFWQDRWREECYFWGGWWRNHKSYYPHATNFVSWTAELEEGTSQRNINRQDTPYLDVDYVSSTGYDCAGKVNVYVAPKDDPSTKPLVEKIKTDIASVDKIIEGYTRSLDDLEREEANASENRSANIAAKIRILQERKVRVFHEQMTRLKQAVLVREQVDALYNEHREHLGTCARILDKLDSNKPIFSAFRESYHQLPNIVERSGLEERLIDQTFGNILLDPVQMNCPNDGGGHNRVHERHKIAEVLHAREEVCLLCSGRVRGLIQIGAQQAELAEIIDDIHNNASAANDELREFVTLMRQDAMLQKQQEEEDHSQEEWARQDADAAYERLGGAGGSNDRVRD